MTINKLVYKIGVNMEDFKRIDRKLEHSGKIVDFYSDTIVLPDGKTTVWDFIEHKGAAAIVPVDEDGRIIMVKQYRNSIDRYTLEIPAGARNPGEDLKITAMRELEEETGYHTDDSELLIDLYTTAAFCNERIAIYYTEQLIPAKKHLDEDEYVEVERCTLEELIDKIFKGEIMDAKTIAAILAYKVKKQHIL